MRALTKTTASGKTATVDIEPSPHGGFVSIARLEGKEVGQHWGAHHQAAGLPVGHVAAIGKLALTADEAALVEAAYRAAEATVGPDLRAQRDRLVADFVGAEEVWADDRARGMDEGDVNPYRNDTANDAAIFLAREALNTFDAEHPEIAVQVMAEQDAAMRRRMDD